MKPVKIFFLICQTIIEVYCEYGKPDYDPLSPHHMHPVFDLIGAATFPFVTVFAILGWFTTRKVEMWKDAWDKVSKNTKNRNPNDTFNFLIL